MIFRKTLVALETLLNLSSQTHYTKRFKTPVEKLNKSVSVLHSVKKQSAERALI